MNAEKFFIKIMSLMLYAFLIYTALNFIAPKDDTDSTETGKRSGMSLYTDYGTGCQYLRKGFLSPLVPRVDKEGNHMCSKGETR